ncbi:hypothetical protein [Priestia megaterium]|uniref:hypothetical protein n=1 Tax=Priestia megaterium TaxID=1404 RepID=UPI000BFC99C5|nr:hypothetical protein [Priestia megaterium]PGO60636.1 hypothetical protein CN981_08790 [Priestia megaterium]
MSYIFQKKKVETFEVKYVNRNFMKFQYLILVRNDVSKCGHCERGFQEKDNTNLAFVTNSKNQLICDDCADLMLENGAEEVEW